MRTLVCITVCAAVLCQPWCRAAGTDWQSLFDRCDSLLTDGETYAANRVCDQTVSRALSQYDRSDTTWTTRIYMAMVPRDCSFRNRDEAKSLYTRVYEIKRRIFVEPTAEIAEIAFNLAELHRNCREWERATDFHEQVLSTREHIFGSDHPEVARSLRGVASLAARAGELDRAESLYIHSQEILEANPEPTNLDLVLTLKGLADLCYGRAGQDGGVYYLDAIAYYERAIPMADEVLGQTDPDLWRMLSRLGRVYYLLGQYGKAVSNLERAVAAGAKSLGPSHPGTAETRLTLAAAYIKIGLYRDAESASRWACADREAAYGSDHPSVAQALKTMAYCQRCQGKFPEAEASFGRAIDILRKPSNMNFRYMAECLDGLAGSCSMQGKYAEAEGFYLEALAICDNDSAGIRAATEADILNNLAVLYYNQGRYGDAEDLYTEALELMRQTLREGDTDLAGALNNLAALYVEMGRYDEAEPVYREALRIRQEALAADHPDIAESMHNLGNLCRNRDRYDEAEEYYRQALAMIENSFGKDHIYAAESLDGLATTYMQQGRLGEAEAQFALAMAIRDGGLPEDHPDIADICESFTMCRRLQKESAGALDLSRRAITVRHRNFHDNVHFLSEPDALDYSYKMRRSAAGYLSCCCDAPDLRPDKGKTTADIVVALKGPVSDEIFGRRRALVTETDSVVIDLFDQLRTQHHSLSELFVQSQAALDVGTYAHELDSLSHSIGDMQSELARRSASFRRSQDIKDVTADRITDLLPARAVLIEYLKYAYVPAGADTSDARYLAAVLAHGDDPLTVDLGPASEIDALVEAYRTHMTQLSAIAHLPTARDRAEYIDIAHRLYRRVIAPVDDHLTGAELLLIAPDGELNLVAFAGLADSGGRYLIEKTRVHYLSAGRDLIRLRYSPEPGRGLFALGNPIYGASAAERLGAIVPREDGHENVEASGQEPVVKRGGGLRAEPLAPLPDSEREIHAITSRWESITDEPTVVCLGSTASEDNFKHAAPGMRIVHLATHGYFLGDPPVQGEGRGRGAAENRIVGANPLLASGLYFAGADAEEDLADTLRCDDGILTAFEVSAMNFAGTELVVLSACETGLGRLTRGEGVYGLRRAFELAGARTIVSALWQVSDVTTADMLANLYMESKTSIPQRMRDMQLSQINKARASGLTDHPHTWAAFVAVGDWQ